MTFLYFTILLYLGISLIFQDVASVSLVDYNSGKQYEFVNTPTELAIDNSIKLITNTTEVYDGSYVKVSWSGVTPTSNNSDYLAVLTPGDMSNVRTRAPSKYITVSQVKGFNETGSGSYTFKLVSSRASFRFVYLQGWKLYPKIKQVSKEIILKDPNKPLHGHLGITGNCGDIVVQWNTRDKSGKEAVYYGTDPDKLTYKAPVALSNIYTAKDVCGPVCSQAGFVNPGYTHNSFLRSLKPNTRYYFIYGSDERGYGFSKVESFRTLNKAGPDEHVFFFATADVGSSEADNSSLTQNEYASRQNYKWLQRDIAANDRYNLYHLHGDIAYADGQLTIWDNYFSQWSSFLTKIPGVITEGNHERDYPGSGDRFVFSSDNSGGECGIPTYNNFYTPNHAVNKSNLWYSFDYGPIHFTHYSTERPYQKGSPQWNFVVNDIKNVDRKKTPWLVMAGHRPFYTASSGNLTQEDSSPSTALAVQTAFEDLVYEYHADMIWQGHVHRYEITCPAYKQKCVGYDKDGVPNGPLYMDIGNGGYELAKQLADPLPEAYQKGKIIFANGYTRLEVNRTHFIQEMIYASNGTLMDRVTIKKPANWGETFMMKMSKPKKIFKY